MGYGLLTPQGVCSEQIWSLSLKIASLSWIFLVLHLLSCCAGLQVDPQGQWARVQSG